MDSVRQLNSVQTSTPQEPQHASSESTWADGQISRPDYPIKCINPERRKFHVSERGSQRPRYVYQLWFGCQRKGKSRCPPQLSGTYSSAALAKHDAICLLIQFQNREGASVEKVFYDPHYENEAGGQCCYYYSHSKVAAELGVWFTAWIIQVPLL